MTNRKIYLKKHLEVLKMNITKLLNEIKKERPLLTAYDLFELAKRDESILYNLCFAAFKTYDEIEHIKKFL